MQKIIQQLSEQIAGIRREEDFTRLKLEMQEALNRLAMEADIVDFKLQRALKDKNVVNSLLTRTSADLKSALQKQESQAEMLNILLDTIPALVYFKDSKLRYQVVNKAFIDFTGHARAEVIGKTLKQVLHHYVPKKKYQELEKRVIKEGAVFYNMEELVEQKGKKIWVHTNIVPVRNKEGKIIGLIGISWDISSQKDYEQQLEHARDMAEEGIRIKDLFLTNMGHEIRTPLNGIIGMAEILKQTSLHDQQEDYLLNLLNSARHLMGLVEDVFEYSAIETGKYRSKLVKFSLSELLNDIGEEFKNETAKKGIGFQIRINPKLPDYFIGDKGSLRIVLRNLLRNAVKFTHEGHVSLSVNPEKISRNNRPLVRFEVEDTGIGVKDIYINKIFESFSQLDISAAKTYQGAGLGLATLKRLLEIMKGEIGVQSSEGKGSVFWFVVPLKTETTEEKGFNETKVIELLRKFRILMVEDNLINQKISKVIFENNGCTLDLANNGKVGFDKYREHPYDLILMDIQMPVMDGLVATQKIRQYEKDKNLRPALIVALTANAMESDRKKTKEAGMNGFIAKPFNPKELFLILNDYIIKK